MLAIARVFASLPERPRRSILFLATTGEELGMLGSTYFTAQPSVPLANIAAVVNIDGATLMRHPLHTVTARGGEHSTLGQTAENAASRLELGIRQATARPIASDHGPFLLRGIPVIWVTGAADSGRADIDGEQLETEWMAQVYHSPKDDLNQPLDFEAGAALAQLDFLIGYQVAQDDERPRWTPGDFFGDTFSVSGLK
jgi:Zn-dependent M28 family amino/carboxypeptidase